MYIDDNTYKDNPAFCNFQHQLIHSSLAKMLKFLKFRITTPEVVHCADDYFCQAVYGPRPYIRDYPEQTVLACVVQNWCPK